MKVRDEIEKKIDTENDGIEFSMTLFNEGRFEREQLRTVIKNVGIKVEIQNQLFEPFEINNFYFGIIINRKLVELWRSTSLSKQFPKFLYPGETKTCFFYGWDIKEKFQAYRNEDGIFIISTAKGELVKCSSKFKGDEMEKDLTFLEDGEYTNWGSIKYHIFDNQLTTSIFF